MVFLFLFLHLAILCHNPSSWGLPVGDIVAEWIARLVSDISFMALKNSCHTARPQPACRQCPTRPPKVIVCGGRVKRGNGGENSWSSSSRVCSWSTAGQEFPLAFGVPFPPSLCSFLQAVDKFPPYKSVTWAGTNGLKGKEPGLEGRREPEVDNVLEDPMG